MRSKDIADLLEHCSHESGCGLCDKWHNGCPGQRSLLNEAAKLIRDFDSVVPHNCKNCIGCELENNITTECDQFILSAERARHRTIADRYTLEEVGSTCKKCNNYSLEEVAQLLCDMHGDDCACNYNGNDEWLPFVCDHCDECPIPAEHLACWKQYLIHLHEKERILSNGKNGVETVSTDVENRNGHAGT